MVVRAPTSWLWIAAVIADEWGHFGALFCLMLAAVCFSRGGVVARSGSLVATVAALFFASPAIRAATIASRLPTRCSEAFGPVQADARVPLSAWTLFRGIRGRHVEVAEHVYAAAGNKRLKLDLYRSAHHDRAQPLVIMIHGGSWKGGGKQELPALNRYLASEGYVVAAINYRHAPDWPFPAAVDDVFSAINFLKERGAEFNIDTTQIALVGRSAGGQIALSAAYAQRDAGIRGVVAFYAPSDLVMGYEHPSAPGVLDSRKVLRDYLGGTPSDKPAVYAAASPVNFVNAATPPTLLIHGGLDPIVSPAHSERLAAKLSEAARPNLYLTLPWGTHGCDANLSGPGGQLSLYAIDRFLASFLKSE